MTMPDPGANLHIRSIDYQCTFGLLPPSGGRVQFQVPDPIHYTCNFETTSTPVPDQPGVVSVAWDYTWFNQAVFEATIAESLSGNVAYLAQMLSLTISQVDAVVLVKRVWTYAPNVQGPGVSSGAIVTTDYMPYPPQVSSADAVTGADGTGQVFPTLAASDAALAADGGEHVA